MEIQNIFSVAIFACADPGVFAKWQRTVQQQIGRGPEMIQHCVCGWFRYPIAPANKPDGLPRVGDTVCCEIEELDAIEAKIARQA